MNDLIVDGNSLYARCWFAVKEDPIETLRLYIGSVLQFLDPRNGRLKVPITRTFFGWDGASKTNKNRQAKPKLYYETRYRVQEAILTLFNTVHGYHEEFEADDIVATAVFNSKARQVFVVSGDKDLMQLQGGNVSYYCLNTKAILPARSICNKFHVKRPSQVALALAILGDRGDGVAGVPKWGPKKVQTLFESVRDDMDFMQAMGAIQLQIPKHLMPCFMDSLDKTLLFNDVEDVPQPSELLFCTSEEVRATGIKGISQQFETVAMQYEDQEAALDSMLPSRIKA